MLRAISIAISVALMLALYGYAWAMVFGAPLPSFRLLSIIAFFAASNAVAHDILRRTEDRR